MDDDPGVVFASSGQNSFTAIPPLSFKDIYIYIFGAFVFLESERRGGGDR